MVPARLTCLLLALASPLAASAKDWKGISPGSTPCEDVASRLGEPTSRVKRDPRTVLAYKGDQALAGTREAQFACRGGVVEEITVFLEAKLDAEAIEGTYGPPQSKTFTDSFQKVWLYPAKGITVFYDKDGGVEAIRYSAGTAPKAAEPKAGEPPKGQPAPAAAPAAPAAPPAR